MTEYADLSSLPEDDRISAIKAAVAKGLTVGVWIDNDDEKVKRYLAKLAPEVHLLERVASGAVVGLRLGPRPQ